MERGGEGGRGGERESAGSVTWVEKERDCKRNKTVGKRIMMTTICRKEMQLTSAEKPSLLLQRQRSARMRKRGESLLLEGGAMEPKRSWIQ